IDRGPLAQPFLRELGERLAAAVEIGHRATTLEEPQARLEVSGLLRRLTYLDEAASCRGVSPPHAVLPGINRPVLPFARTQLDPARRLGTLGLARHRG